MYEGVWLKYYFYDDDYVVALLGVELQLLTMNLNTFIQSILPSPMILKITD